MVKRSRISTKPVKYSADEFEAHTSNPLQVNLKAFKTGELEVVSGELTDGFELITLGVSYNEFIDPKLAQATILAAQKERKMIAERTEEELLSGLTVVHEEMSKLQAKLDELQAQARAITDIALKRLALEHNVDVEDLEYGYHLCDSNKNLHCVYNTMEDPARDECLRCGMPHERK